VVLNFADPRDVDLGSDQLLGGVEDERAHVPADVEHERVGRAGPLAVVDDRRLRTTPQVCHIRRTAC
jgi:hypothetical protein